MAWTIKAGRGIDASENKKPRHSSGRVARVCVERLRLRVDASNPHSLVQREMGEADAHPLLMLGANVVLDFLGLDAGEFRDFAKRVHAFRAVERCEDAFCERVELLPDHRGSDGGESLVLGGVAFLDLRFAGAVLHGEVVIGRGAGLTQAFSNHPPRTQVRRIRSGRECPTDTSSSSSRGRTSRCDRGRCRSRPLGSSSACHSRRNRRGCHRVLFRGLGICSW